jgi:hypothetical protein
VGLQLFFLPIWVSPFHPSTSCFFIQMVSITEISGLEPTKIRSICTQKKMESKCFFTFLQVRSFTLMHRVCWSRLFRQIVGADAASSADGASSPAKGDCAKSIGISIATKNKDYRVIQCIDKLRSPL